MMRVLERFRS